MGKIFLQPCTTSYQQRPWYVTLSCGQVRTTWEAWGLNLKHSFLPLRIYEIPITFVEDFKREICSSLQHPSHVVPVVSYTFMQRPLWTPPSYHRLISIWRFLSYIILVVTKYLVFLWAFTCSWPGRKCQLNCWLCLTCFFTIANSHQVVIIHQFFNH